MDVVACVGPASELRLEPGVNEVAISWVNPTDPAPEHVFIEVSGPDGFTKLQVVDGELEQARVTGLRNGVTYSFRITTAAAGGASAPTDWVSATPTTGTEGVVAGLIVQFADGVDVRDGQQLVPGEQRVDSVDLAIADQVAEGSVLVELSEPVAVDEARTIARDLEADAAVTWAEPDSFLFTAGEASSTQLASPVSLPADSQYGTDQWNLWDAYGIGIGDSSTTMTTAWAGARGDGVTVAVIDTGITSHPDLDGQVVPGYDFVSSPEQLAAVRRANAPPMAFDGDSADTRTFGVVGRDENPADPGDWSEVAPARASTWHGTKMAGLIAAASNADGITGIAPGARIQPVRALSWRGGLLSDIAASITWASGGAVDGAPVNATPSRVINLSFAAEATCPRALQEAIDGARVRGSILVAAAGNASADAGMFAPGNCAGVVTVGASNRDGSRADYSNYGAAIDLSAPGGDSANPVASTANRGAEGPDAPTTARDFGTSIAAAHVSAAAAVLMSRSGGIAPDELASMLTGGYTKPFAGASCDSANPDVACGSGILSLAQVAAAGDTDSYIALNGSNQRAKAANGYYPIQNGSGQSFTVSAWAYDSVTNGGWAYIAAQQAGSGDQSFFMGTFENSQEMNIAGWNNGDGHSKVWLPVGQWVHVALTRSGQNAQLYINGQVAAETNTYVTWVNNSQNPFRVGSFVDDRLEYWNGRIDQVKVYDTALTLAQVNSDMESWGAAAGVSASSLLAHYDFNDVSGTTIANRGANGSTGNLTTSNSPTYADIATTSTSGTTTTVTFPRSYLTANLGWLAPAGVNTTTSLVVGGGGGGGYDGGGGGGGGAVYDGAVSINAGGRNTVLVGGGGAGRFGYNPGNYCRDGNTGVAACSGNVGARSQLAGVIAGGGGGGGGKNADGSAAPTETYRGGGGGGGSSDFSVRSGGDGVLPGGTGGTYRQGGGGGSNGGYGATGTNADNVIGGYGGGATTSSRSGTAVAYGGGGTSGAWGCGSCIATAPSGAGTGGNWGVTWGSNGLANQGGGGGGGGGNGTVPGYGGSGVVILTYSTLPGAPTSPTATAGVAQATVSWTAPTYTGGSSITSYTVTASPRGATCTPSPATATSCIVTGLTVGTSYTFTVKATNAQGVGAASTNSNSVTPLAASCTQTDSVIGNFAYVAFTVPSGATCTTTWTPPGASMSVDYLAVAGGGGGGVGRGGGGGAGGLLTGSTTASSATSVQVGQGGAGGTLAANNGVQGASSFFGSIIATGGGAGGGWNYATGTAGSSGGSGGGASGSEGTSRSGGAGAPGQGTYGGSNGSPGNCRVGLTNQYCGGGGGGGATAVGGNGSTAKGGDGGAGSSAPAWLTAAARTALGIPAAYAGGGGGAGEFGVGSTVGGAGGTGGGGAGCGGNGDCNGTAGTAKTGGGGGGGEGGTGVGGAGGTGLVVIRYSANALSLAAGAGTQPGSYTYGTGWVTAPKVQLVDAAGATVSTSGVTVTATFTATSGSATLSNATDTTDANGVADFSGMTLTGNAGTAGTLTFTAADYATVTSGSFSIAKAQQAALSIDAPYTLAYGATLPLSTTGGSGTGALSYQGTGTTGTATCSVVDAGASSTLTGTNAGGTCRVAAEKAGDTNYDLVLVEQDFTVTTRPIEITATSPSVTYPSAISQSSSITSGSLGLSDAISGLTYTYVGTGSTSYGPSTTAPTAAGTYSVTPSAMTLAAGRPTSNYAVQYVSGTVTIAQNSQTIAFGSITDRTYGAAPFSVSATSDSGLPVTLTSTTTDVCTVSGGVVTIVGSAIGGATCSITASQAGNANVAAAQDVTQTFQVAQAAQATLTMSSPSTAVYGETVTLAAVGGSGTGALGFAVTSPVGPGLCSVSGTTLTLGAAGSLCKVQATKLASANYLIKTSAEQTITITKAGQALAFTSAVPVTPERYDTYTPVAAITTSTGVASSVTPGFAVSGNCTLSGGVVTFGLPGTCTITASAPSDTNFTAATNVTQVIEIGATNQTITFTQPSNVSFGSSSVAMSATTTSGGDVTFARGSGTTNNACSVSSLGVVTILAVGSCEVVASAAAFDQYAAASDVARTFEVVPALATAPTLTSGSASSQAITVGFTAPGFTGGVAITAYEVVATPVTVGAASVVTSTACASSPCTIGGLVNGVAYTVKIAAINSAGTGPYSGSTGSLTPATAAFAVGSLTAVPGDTTVTVSWTQPTDLGGGTFVRYDVYSRPVGGSYGAATVVGSGSIATTSTTFTGLDNGTSYDFKVVAITTANGSEIPGNTAEVVQYPSTVPSAPRAPVVLAATATDVQFSWSAPVSDGGAVLSTPNYTVTVTGSAGAAAVTCTPAGTATHCTASGLTNGASYVFSVVANNRMGSSPAATVTYNVPSSVATLSDLVLASGGAPVALSPAFTSGTTAYTVTVPNAVTSVTVTPTTTSAGATATVDGVAVVSGQPSAAIALPVGTTTITVVVTASDPRYTSTTTVAVTRVAAAGGDTGGGPTPGLPVQPPAEIMDGSVRGAVLEGGRLRTDVVLAERGSGSGWSVAGAGFSLAVETATPSGAPVPLAADGAMRVPQGGLIEMAGTGYEAGSELAVFALPMEAGTAGRLLPRSAPVATYLGSLRVGAAGAVDGTLGVPLSMPIGRYVLQLNGLADSEQVRSVNLRLEVVAAPRPQARVGVVQRAGFYEGQSAQLSRDGRSKIRAIAAAVPSGAQAVQIQIAGVSVGMDSFASNVALAGLRAERLVKELRRAGVVGEVTVSVTATTTTQRAGEKDASSGASVLRTASGKPLTTVTVLFQTPTPG